ncbi:MAG: dTDP-4-dehydrorhamnose 3,5-epimerase [Bradymonadales bacterium]|nr:dTDP-4-dehydrorhamnose 3,5-epimerase [Bradymonadales bacterium]
MNVITTDIPEVLLLEAEVFEDQRGYLLESYSQRSFRKAGITVEFVQDNLSFSRRGVLRGLHYQVTKPQAKLVTVLSGRVFDVAVDIRRGSPTFGRWVALELTGPKGRSLLAPAGFAHGICALEDALVLYKMSELFHADLARGIAWDDPELSIPWPIADPLLSRQDRLWPSLAEADLLQMPSGSLP